MKYWIFQNNQVLGPYGPDELSKVSSFSPESLVCSEGRRGTSMGDWQRAGMVPDLSVVLVRASTEGAKTATLSHANLPSEPTLKDMAVIGSVQEKVASLEAMLVQLQEGQRAKDAELSALRQELTSKARETGEIRNEAVERQREAEALKRQVAGLEDRLSSLRLLSETLDKAVEEEKRVEQDVEKQGNTIGELTKEIENMSRQLAQRNAAASAAAAPAAASPVEAPPPAQFAPTPFVQSSPAPVAQAPAAPIEPIAQDLSFTPSDTGGFAPVAAPQAEPPSSSPEPAAEMAAAKPEVEIVAQPEPESSVALQPAAVSFDPMSFSGPAEPPAAEAAAEPAPAPALASFGAEVLAPEPAAAKSRKPLIFGAIAALGALAALAVVAGYTQRARKSAAEVAVLAPAAPPPAPNPVAETTPAPDLRQSAIDLAKAWPLPGGKPLGRALDELAPASGNLSPWMAETLAGGRVQVNYFARGAASGAPTIAYEFEADLEGKTLVGRNAAAKSVLTGTVAAPPAPPKAKPVKVKPKTKAAAKTAPLAVKTPPAAEQAAPPADGGLDAVLGEPASSPAPAPAAEKPLTRPAAARRAAKVKAKADAPAADESLLDDLLKE